MDTYWRAPPIARYAPLPPRQLSRAISLTVHRTVATAAFVTSLSVFLGLLPGHWIIFWSEKVFTFPPQIWRIWTNFLLTGSGISLLFDTYFLYTYTSALEVGNPRFSKREDIVWYLIFVSGVTTVSYASPLPSTCRPMCFLFCLCLLFTTTNTPRHICPHSVSYNYSGSWKRGRLPLRHGVGPITNLRTGPWRGHGGMSYGWLVRFSPYRSSGFYSSLHFFALFDGLFGSS